jgi:hypothetical protein
MSGNWWEGLQTAGFNDQKNPFTDGNYLLEVESIRTHNGWEGGKFLIIAFKTLQADNGVLPGTPRTAPPIALDGKNARMALGEINAFIFELFGLDRTNPAMAELAVQLGARMTIASNPYAGAQIAAEARTIDVKPTQRNPSGKFCKPRWIRYPQNPKTYQDIMSAPMGVQLPPTVSTPHFALQGGQQPQATWGPPPPAAAAPAPWGPPPPTALVKPPNLPPSYTRADGKWWDGKDWVGP